MNLIPKCIRWLILKSNRMYHQNTNYAFINSCMNYEIWIRLWLKLSKICYYKSNLILPPYLSLNLVLIRFNCCIKKFINSKLYFWVSTFILLDEEVNEIFEENDLNGDGEYFSVFFTVRTKLKLFQKAERNKNKHRALFQ